MEKSWRVTGFTPDEARDIREAAELFKRQPTLEELWEACDPEWRREMTEKL